MPFLRPKCSQENSYKENPNKFINQKTAYLLKVGVKQITTVSAKPQSNRKRMKKQEACFNSYTENKEIEDTSIQYEYSKGNIFQGLQDTYMEYKYKIYKST